MGTPLVVFEQVRFCWECICTMSGERDEVSSYLVIDLRNKPFGAVLPVEIQNRIVWMSMQMVHADTYREVKEELECLPTCELVEWVSVANQTKHFTNTYSVCTECFNYDCIHMEAQDICHWCRLYTHDQKSLYQLEVSRKLNRERDALGCYEDEKYRQFVQANRQRYADCLKYSFMVCRLPMLCHVPPSERQTNFARIHEEVTFEEIYIGVEMVLDEFVEKNGLNEYRNPRLVREEAHKALQGVEEMRGTMWRVPPSEEEVRDMSEDILARVEEQVDEFLKGYPQD